MMHTLFFIIYNHNLNCIVKIKCYTYSWQNKTVVLFVYGEQLQESFHQKIDMYGNMYILREEECIKENKIVILKIIMLSVTQ